MPKWIWNIKVFKRVRPYDSAVKNAKIVGSFPLSQVPVQEHHWIHRLVSVLFASSLFFISDIFQVKNETALNIKCWVHFDNILEFIQGPEMILMFHINTIALVVVVVVNIRNEMIEKRQTAFLWYDLDISNYSSVIILKPYHKWMLIWRHRHRNNSSITRIPETVSIWHTLTYSLETCQLRQQCM